MDILEFWTDFVQKYMARLTRQIRRRFVGIRHWTLELWRRKQNWYRFDVLETSTIFADNRIRNGFFEFLSVSHIEWCFDARSNWHEQSAVYNKLIITNYRWANICDGYDDDARKRKGRHRAFAAKSLSNPNRLLLNQVDANNVFVDAKTNQ